MAGVNKVILIGNLGKDPEVRRLENGTAVCSFPLATSESYNDRNTGQRVTNTEWHNIVMWRGLAEIAEKYLKKGNSIYVEGKLRTRSWEDQDKNMRYITEVVANEMTMLGGRSNNSEDNNQSQYGNNNAAANNSASNTSNNSASNSNQDDFANSDDDDDLPF